MSAKTLDTGRRAVPAARRAPPFRMIETRRALVRARVAGPADAPAVVLAPDPPNGIEHSGALIDDLAIDHRVVCYELPGFGFSSAERDFSFGLDHQAEALIGVLEALSLANATLALTCAAALAALRAANLRPDLVARLVLAQAPSLGEACAWARRVDFHGAVATPYLGQALMRGLGAGVARVWYANALPKAADAAPYLEPAFTSLEEGARFPLASGFQALLEEPDSAARFAVDCPVHVVWGTGDRTHKRTDKESVRAYAPRATVEQFEGCGHFPDLEMPARFARSIRRAEGEK